MDSRDSVLQAPGSDVPTETQYTGQCRKNLLIIDKISFVTKTSAHNKIQHGTRSL